MIHSHALGILTPGGRRSNVTSQAYCDSSVLDAAAFDEMLGWMFRGRFVGPALAHGSSIVIDNIDRLEPLGHAAAMVYAHGGVPVVDLYGFQMGAESMADVSSWRFEGGSLPSPKPFEPSRFTPWRMEGAQEVDPPQSICDAAERIIQYELDRLRRIDGGQRRLPLFPCRKIPDFEYL